MENCQNNEVIVTVDADGNVGCKPDPLPVRGRNVLLKFELQAPGYVFPAEGAAVVADPGQEFPEPSRTLPPNETRATLLDRNTGPGDFPYTVTVMKLATGELRRHDPMISNGP